MSSAWHQRQWRRIEDEYNEPPREVVRVLHHEMRVPLCQCADLLYVSEKTVRLWCRWWALATHKAGYTKRAVDGRVLLRARALGFDDIAQALAHYRADGLRWEDVRAVLRCGDATIARHMPEDAKGRYNLTTEGRAVKRATMRRLIQDGRAGKGFRDVRAD